MSKHQTKTKLKSAELNCTPRATDHVYHLDDQVQMWKEKQINSGIGIHRASFTVPSFDIDTKIVIIEEEPGKVPKRYNTAQVSPYAEDSEGATLNFMSSLNKVIANHRNTDDDGAQ